MNINPIITACIILISNSVFAQSQNQSDNYCLLPEQNTGGLDDKLTDLQSNYIINDDKANITYKINSDQFWFMVAFICNDTQPIGGIIETNYMAELGGSRVWRNKSILFSVNGPTPGNYKLVIKLWLSGDRVSIKHSDITLSYPDDITRD